MSKKKEALIGLESMSEYFRPAPPKVIKRKQQSLQDGNIATSEKK